MDLGPISAIICWQSIILAMVVVTLTHGVKKALDSAMGGAEAREKVKFVDNLVLPAIPIVLGAVLAMVLPLTPDLIAAWVVDHALSKLNRLLVLASFGVVVGQFSDYAFHRISGLLEKQEAAVAPGLTLVPPAAPVPGDAGLPGSAVLVTPSVTVTTVPPPPSIPPVAIVPPPPEAK